MPPPNHHGIWGCLHYLPLVLNVFLAQYDSGTFLSHLTDGGYGFNSVKAGIHYVGVGLVYKSHNLFTGNTNKCAMFLRTFFDRCESEIEVAPSQAYFLWKRKGVGPLCHPMPSWIYVDIIISCPGVIDKEGADSVGVHSSQTITFRMMIATSHFFNGIEERLHVFIPLEFKHQRDTRLRWRTAIFSYLNGVWEWVQVTNNHIANHYTLLAHTYAAEKASTPTHAQVSSRGPPSVHWQLLYCQLDYHTKEEPQPVQRVPSGM